MAIKYFPNRAQIASKHAIEQNIIHPKQVFRVGGDITSAGLDEILSPIDGDWRVSSIAFSFGSATSRDYSLGIQNGRKVVSKYNDFLWIQTTNSLWQKITLDKGFYTGTELAAHLKTKLDENEQFDDLGVTFTVDYDNASGIFTITPSATQIKYIQEYKRLKVSDQNSIAGHLFGFNENTGFENEISSDTSVPGLDDLSYIIRQLGSTATSHYHDDIHELSIDHAVRISTSAAALDATVTIQYQEI